MLSRPFRQELALSRILNLQGNRGKSGGILQHYNAGFLLLHFSKAYDTILYHNLLIKRHAIAGERKIFSCIACHAKDGEHCVASNEHISRNLNAFSEVSQCSVLAPINFNLCQRHLFIR